MIDKPKKTIGRADRVDLPEHGLFGVPAKVDTGAKTSAVWASNAHVRGDLLVFTFFGPESPLYTGEEHTAVDFEQVAVSSSSGHTEVRYKLPLLLKVRGKKIRANFTLADRSQQAYPVLIGRNALRGKFLVDVKRGRPDRQSEQERRNELRSKREQAT